MTKLLVKNNKISKASKLNNATVFNFGIPAFKSKTGLVTCPSAKTCIKPCYAGQGAYNYPAVKNAYEYRLQQSLKDSFKNEIQKEIDSKRKITHIRIHDSGDFYSLDYLKKWIDICKNNSNITFYAYTKEVKLFKSVSLPENMIIIYSYGGRDDHLIDTKKDRFAYVFDHESKVPSNFINASINDLNAIKDNKKIALVYHGAKSRNNFKNLKGVA